jgi:hypothetical protein
VIRTYKYIHTVHSKLHDYVLAFFLKIKTDTNGFRDELFELEFLPIVNRHPKILKERFKTIYEHVISISETDRQLFCHRVIESNQIEKICRGEYRPEAFTGELTEIDVTLKQLFLDLYKQVLDGPPFQENVNTTLREHFNQFSDTNADITLCPFCGIGELKKSQDKTRDPYDHYLPKSLYPFSSINFQNLVPSCKDCNSFDVKGEKDTIAVSTGKLFFPYDDSHKEISLVVNVQKDNSEPEKIEWELVFISPDNKNDEIQSWKTIYSIEDRYQGYIQARIEKWYRHFYGYNKSLKTEGIDLSTRIRCYMEVIEQDNSFGLNYIRKLALEGLLSGSNIVQAQVEALEYV